MVDFLYLTYQERNNKNFYGCVRLY